MLRTFLLITGLPAAVVAQGPLDRMADIRRAINAGNTEVAFALLDTLAAVALDPIRLYRVRLPSQ